MSVKALKRQFAAAVAMVVVSAVALSSSTYAWFANNNVVSATGMSVQATAEGGIEIKAISSTQPLGSGYTDSWATTADAKIASTTLYPTSTIPAATDGVLTGNWYHASADAATGFAATGATYAKLQTIASTCNFTNGVESGNGVLAYESGKSGSLNAGAYYLATTYNIAGIGTEASDLMVQGVTVTGNNISFDNSLRVAVVCGSNVALYAPIGYTDEVSYKVATATTGTPVALAVATMPAAANVTAMPSSQTSDVLAATVGTETDPTEVNVYVWFEGEDTNHYTNNATAVDGLAVTVNFVATVG